MSRILCPTQTQIQNILNIVKQNIKDTVTSGKTQVNSINLLQTDDKCTIHISASAYVKIKRLVNYYSSEIAWHGVATKDTKGVYTISDILVYPQIVSSCTVDTDEKAYGDWLFEQDQFKDIRFQGHSHVNMSVSPSSTDLNHRKELLSTLTDNDFYIFAIVNKKDEYNWLVQDNADNIVYDTDDITFVVDIDDNTLDEFMSDTSKQISSHTSSTSNQCKSDVSQIKNIYKANHPQSSSIDDDEEYIDDEEYMYDDEYEDYFDRFGNPIYDPDDEGWYTR